MILAVDVGNSGITLGVFNQNNLIKRFWLQSDICETEETYREKLSRLLADYDINGCVIASVYDELTDTIKYAVNKTFSINPYMLTSNSKFGIELNVKSPNSVGADRIANSAAAYSKYHRACVVVDIGTATTFDVVNSKGEFIGGIIMPGIKLQLASLHDYTSKLPLVQYKKTKDIIAKDTEGSILAGVVIGHCKAIPSLIKDTQKTLGEPAKVILTGGYAEELADCIEYEFAEINSNLTLEGLNFIYCLNN